MKGYNENILNMLMSKLEDLTLTTETGKFLADKSYGFDTIFLGARFINRFRFGNKFYKMDFVEKSNKYYSDLFCLSEDASQVGNYMTETLALLCFAKVLHLEKRSVYEIIDDELLDFISSSFEHSYIFLYTLCYCVFKHDNIWSLYEQFCIAKSIDKKQYVYEKIREKFIEKDSRIIDPDKEWANFIPKYPMVVLNYANKQNMISRTVRVKSEIVTREDIALNVQGTRANYDLPKKNSYIDDLSDSYIFATLAPIMTRKVDIDVNSIEYSDSFSIDVADLKLDMLDTKNVTKERKRKMQDNKYKLTASGMRVRTVQDEFRSGLLKTLPHVCPVCGFTFDKFLIASHIKPYSVCDDTYDAMNPNNGLLMCPICDKLFENANYITINYVNGNVEYESALIEEKDFQYLKSKTLSINYIDCERKHYLKWHNEQFRKKHASDVPPMSSIVEGIVVNHVKFGFRVIKKLSNGILYVMFGKEEKKFLYPLVFEKRELSLYSSSKAAV